MADALGSLTLDEFRRAVGAREPVPGGGSVSAHVAALGASLGAMAARFTEGKRRFAEHADRLADEIAELDGLAGECAGLVEADARAFARVGEAMALPKDTDAAKAARRAAMQDALREAMQPPLACCRLAARALAVLDALRGHTTRHLLSDVAVGAHLLRAAYAGAWVNVLVNAGALDDRALADEVAREGAALRDRVERRHAAIVAAIEPGLG